MKIKFPRCRFFCCCQTDPEETNENIRIVIETTKKPKETTPKEPLLKDRQAGFMP